MLKILLLLSFLKANPYPDINMALLNIDSVGPQLMLSVSKLVDMNCKAITSQKNAVCLIPAVYGDYLRAATYLSEKSSAQLNDLYIPENFANVDYRATNWHLGPFTQSSSHAEIIENIYRLEMTKHLLSLLVVEFKKQLDTVYKEIPLQYRYSQLPLLTAWLAGTSKFSQYYQFSKLETCLKNQTLCQTQKDQFRKAISEIKKEYTQEILNTKNRIENYGSEPWEEAKLLKQVYELDSHIIKMKNLNVDKTISLWRGNISIVPSLNKYLKELQEITSTPKVLSDDIQVKLYREVINLKEIERINLNETNSSVIPEDLHEILNNSVSETINTVGQFYLERESEITNGN